MDMRTLADQLESLASAAWQKAENEAVEIIQEIGPIVEDGLVKAVEHLGQLAVLTVMQLMGAAGVVDGRQLSGSEKHNLAVTTIVDQAAQKGLDILATDISALVKNSFVAIVSQKPHG